MLVLAGAGAYLWAPWRSEPAVRPPSGPYVPSGPADRALLWAVGDGADGGAAARSVVARMKRKRFDRLLYLGDVYGSGLLSLVTGDGTAADYRDRYDPLYGAFAEPDRADAGQPRVAPARRGLRALLGEGVRRAAARLVRLRDRAAGRC